MQRVIRLFVLLIIFNISLAENNIDLMETIRNEYDKIFVTSDMSKMGPLEKTISSILSKSVNFAKLDAIFVNNSYNPTLFNLIKETCNEMQINLPKEIVIFKGDEKSKKNSEIWGYDFRLNAFVNNSMAMFIGEELLNNLTYDELRAIVAHELAHVKLMHPKKKFEKNIINNCMLLFGGSLLGQLLRKNNVDFIKTLGISLAFGTISSTISIYNLMKYSRQCEHEADQEALKIIKDKNILISALGKLEKLINDNFKKSKLNKFLNKFSTHPLLEDRDAHLAKVVLK